MADGQRRLFGVDLHGGDVERMLGSRLGEQKTRNAADGDAGRGAEAQLDPRAVLAGLKRPGFAVHIETGAGTIRNKLKRNGEGLAVVAQNVLWTFEQAFERHGPTRQRIAAAAFVFGFFQARREERETALRTLEVGCRHGREHPAVEAVRRKRDRDANDGGRDEVLAEEFPERLAAAAHLDVRTRQRNPPTSEFENAARRMHAGRGQLWNVALQVPIEEVEDVVLARVDAGREGGPGDGRQRG